MTLTPNDAITIFLKQVERGLPFPITIPPLTTEQAQSIFYDKIREAEISLVIEPTLSIDELQASLGLQDEV